VLVLARRRRILDANPPMARLTGYASAQLIGHGMPYPFAPSRHEDEFALAGAGADSERVPVREDGALVADGGVRGRDPRRPRPRWPSSSRACRCRRVWPDL
jgi:PAS domain S-box-containing protein